MFAAGDASTCSLTVTIKIRVVLQVIYDDENKKYVRLQQAHEFSERVERSGGVFEILTVTMTV